MEWWIESSADADAVVVGFDRGVTYTKLKDASVLVARGVFHRVERRRLLPGTRGEAWPGAGALVAAIETTTGATAELIGKPEAPLLELALDAAGGDARSSWATGSTPMSQGRAAWGGIPRSC